MKEPNEDLLASPDPQLPIELTRAFHIPFRFASFSLSSCILPLRFDTWWFEPFPWHSPWHPERHWHSTRCRCCCWMSRCWCCCSWPTSGGPASPSVRTPSCSRPSLCRLCFAEIAFGSETEMTGNGERAKSSSISPLPSTPSVCIVTVETSSSGVSCPEKR